MRVFSKKRLLLVGGTVTTVAAAGALLAGATFGFFSSAGVASGSNTFTAGNVVVGLDGGGTQVTCAIGPMSPGDTQASLGSGSGQNVHCEYDVKYTGNVSAYLGLDLAITGAPGSAIETPYGSSAPSAAQGLYDGTSTGLQFDIHDATTTYVTGVTYLGQGATGAVTLTPTGGAVAIQNLLVNSSPVAANATRHLVVNYSLPSGAGNAYNLATSHIVLTIHAVQSDNITLPGTCSNGKLCSTGMTWS